VRHDDAYGRVGTLIVENAIAYGAYATVRIEAKSRLMDLLTSVIATNETLAPGFDPFDNLSQPHRE
jgi:hypothetical protein